MKNMFQKFVKICPQTGKVKGFRSVKVFSKLLFPIIGLAALLWIVFRIVPKPSRASYPCVKAATPLASGFLIYISSLVASALIFYRTKKRIFLSPYFAILGLVIFGFSGSMLVKDSDADPNAILPKSVHIANNPTGEAKGIFPGRVVWAFDPNATNENCNPVLFGHGWFMPENTNQNVVDGMVSKVIQSLAGKTTDKESWDEVFKYHNNTRGKGAVSYKAGEKIFIKINATSSGSGNFIVKDLSVAANNSYGISETSPPIVLSVLRQLVKVVGVSQSDIYVGDPMKHIYKHSFDLWHAEFPNVHYLDHDNSYSALGREQALASTTARIFYSDKGLVLRANVWDAARPGEGPITDDYLYKILENAEYLISIPMLKGHKRAGITAFAKNHFGSQTRVDASHLHNGLVDPQKTPNLPGVSRTNYGMYRVQVDIMGHKLLGEKNLFFLMDALWASDDEISYPKKFTMKPFNKDWMSSIFASLDPVAIESVGYDFLRTEFTDQRQIGDGAGTYPQKKAADDYLHQASDPTLWPTNIKYDPNNTGAYLKSLGTHEHWKNETDMQYSRNLNAGNGIELVKIMTYVDVEKESGVPSSYLLSQNYPNPFNPVTTISYSIPKSSKVVLKIFDSVGKEISTLEDKQKTAGNYQIDFDAKQLASGVYFYQLQAGNFISTKKLVLIK